MKLSILISTLDAGIKKVRAVLLEPLTDVTYYLSHQVTTERFLAIPPELKRKDVVVSQIEGRGMCRNRNNTLKIAGGDIALLADDDVRYKPEYFQRITEAFASDQTLDVACFKISTPAGEREYKEYSTTPYKLNEESRHYISSIEIAVRLAAVRNKNIFFDERFGLGSQYIQFGEEAVFIYDCIRAGLQVKYIPEYIVEHTATSTAAKSTEFDRVRVIFKGAYDAHRYGWKAFPAALLGTLTLWPKLRAERKSPLRYFQERLSGAGYIFCK